MGQQSSTVLERNTLTVPSAIARRKAGGWDPKARIGEMETDGVSDRVLYPTLGLLCSRWKMPSARSLLSNRQRLYDRLLQVTPGRLIGIR